MKLVLTSIIKKKKVCPHPPPLSLSKFMKLRWLTFCWGS